MIDVYIWVSFWDGVEENFEKGLGLLGGGYVGLVMVVVVVLKEIWIYFVV